MREISIEMLAGTWRCQSESKMDELIVRPGGPSFYTILDKKGEILFEQRGLAKLDMMADHLYILFDAVILGEIWYAPSESEIWLVHNDHVKMRFVKVN